MVLEAPPRVTRPKASANDQKSNGASNGASNGLDSAHKLGVASYKIKFLYVLSGNSEKSVRSQMQNIGIYLEQRPETLELSLMGKLAYTLCERRSFLTWKVAVTAESSAELVRKLSNPDLRSVSAFNAPKVLFAFTGQGAQWHAMGRELMATYPVFASTISMADECLKSLGASWSLQGTFHQKLAAHLLTWSSRVI